MTTRKNETFNTDLAVEAEQARQEVDGDTPAGSVKVKALSPVSIAGKTHDTGATFTAPEDSVRDALARGLVEQAKK